MSTSLLEALLGKLVLKRHSHSIFYILASRFKMRSGSPAYKTLYLKTLVNFLYISANPAIQQVFSKPCLVNLISKDTHLVFSISRRASRCQQGLLKPYLVNLISKDTHLVFFFYLDMPCDSTSVLEDLPGKLDIKDTHLIWYSLLSNALWCYNATTHVFLNGPRITILLSAHTAYTSVLASILFH